MKPAFTAEIPVMRGKRQSFVTGHSALKCGFVAMSIAVLVDSGCPILRAQLPDAPSVLVGAPNVVAPLRRYSFNFGMDSKYSLTSSVVEFTPRVGVSMRLGERETIGLSFSHPMPANVRATQSNSVIVWTNFRVISWGKIPKSH